MPSRTLATEAGHAAVKAREWTLRRDAAIRDALAAGVSLRVLAATTGLSHTAVAKIGARGT